LIPTLNSSIRFAEFISVLLLGFHPANKSLAEETKKMAKIHVGKAESWSGMMVNLRLWFWNEGGAPDSGDEGARM
jgi:hypothetical protein